MFFFDRFHFTPNSGELSLLYSYKENVFEEKIFFPIEGMNYTKEKEAVLERIFFLTHIACGISYYKAFLTKEISIKSGLLTQKEADFFKDFYLYGLGEFAYRNNIHLEDTLRNLFNSSAVEKPQKELFIFSNKVLVPVGGGKDSCVSMELLKHKTNLDVHAFSIGTATPIQNCINASKLPHLSLKRKISPALLTLNEKGSVFNGHVPITGIISFLTWICAVLYDYKYIAFSCENSSNFGNLKWGEIEINHQYSKSIHFETSFKELMNLTLKGIEYFSLLRPLTEIHISKLFSRYCRSYFPYFTSCNRLFYIDESKRLQQWCCTCDKCRFVFLVLAVHMNKKDLLDIMGNKNLFDMKENLSGYKELLGITGHKPFECVGEIKECRYAFKQLIQKEEWKNDFIIKELSKELKEDIQKDFYTYNKHFIPKEIYNCVFAEEDV